MHRDPASTVNIRVYKRMGEGTILIWNTQSLDDEQKKNYKVEIRGIFDHRWLEPVISAPDTTRMPMVLDQNQQTTMIMHKMGLEEDTPFIAKFTFGTGLDVKEASVRVHGANSHMPFIKPIRTRSGVYALPIVIVDDLRGGLPLPEDK